MIGMIDVKNLKKEIAKSGKDNRSILYIKAGEKKRVRFLDDLQEGTEIKFHDSFKLSVNVPCQEQYGRPCSHCDNENLRTRNQYFWSVYDYESKERKLLMAAVNNCSPIPSMSAIHEEYNTLKDRDYVIKRMGSGQDTSYALLPMAETEFKNRKVKPYTEKEIFALIDKIYKDEEATDEEPKKKGVEGKMNTPTEADDDWDEDEGEGVGYDSMSRQELYKLCKKRGIDCKPKQPKDFYVDLLVDYDADKAEDDWDEDEDEGELPFH